MLLGLTICGVDLEHREWDETTTLGKNNMLLFLVLHYRGGPCLVPIE